MAEGTAAVAAATNDGGESFVDTVIEDGQQQGSQGEGEGGSAAAPQKPDDLKAAMTELATTVRGLATPKQQQHQPSQDEINELWAVYDPEKANPDFFKKWMRLQADMDPTEAQSTIAERKALFGQMQQGLMKQAITGSKNIIAIELAKFREEYGPLAEYVSSAKAEKTRERFFTGYESLADAKFAKIIDATARTLADKTFDSEESYFKALAEGAAETIKGVLPEFDLGAKPQKPAVTSPRLPRTRVGGTGGTAAGGKTPAKGESDDDSDTLEWMK